jgi:NAD(P)-dependent dehydrogenase (short-subunit alcohol dehydrogenase family)
VNTSSGAGVRGIAGQAAYCAAKFGMIGLTKAPALDYRMPRQIYQEGPWICGRSAVPAGCAFPASRASSESGEMLAFAHIPTGATANKGFAIDQVKGRTVASAIALTAIGADTETGRATP